jgi:hypothetical protein
MGVFKSERRIWTDVTDLEPVALHLASHFQAKGYEVMHQQTATGAWDIDITRSGVFRTISGMRTALKVRLEPDNGSVMARAGIGILGQQALPTMVSMLVFWPILVGQIWGAVQSSKVDDEALRVIEEGLSLAGSGSAEVPAARAASAGAFCGECGTAAAGGKFCTGCGAPLPTRAT